MEHRPVPFLLAIGLGLIFFVPSSAQTADQSSTPSSARSSVQSSAPRFDLSGVIAASGLARFDAAFEPVFSLRFIPEIKFSLAVGRGVTLDAEASANVFGSAAFLSDAPTETSGDIKPYRGWLRFSTSRFEARVGLQKLSFGSATLFRPLMWFDSLDPRDPLQLTDGVYGLLLRYFTKGNANFWAWGLLGNSDRRGWDLARPDKRSPEFGGRVQVPLFKGEAGATYHHREADLNPDPPPGAEFPTLLPVPEDRFGLDGKWDLGVGVSFEAVLVHQATDLLPFPWQSALTLGLDYTFALGRGLTLMAEQFRLASSARALGPGEALNFSALFLRYPLGLFNEVSGIFYYDWTNHDLYRFLSWKLTTNAISLNVIFFWNPTELLVFQGQAGSGSFAGTGLMLLLAYNF